MKQYFADKMKSIPLGFAKSTDADILEKLDSVPNLAGYIKRLIREDMQNEQK